MGGRSTGANDLFIFDLLSDEGNDLCLVANDYAGEVVIETALLEEAVFGSQVKRYDAIKSNHRLLYPYRKNVPIEETELQNRYPHAWSYFIENRTLLSSRGSLKKTNGRFFELVWPRDERWLRQPKLLIRDLAPTTAFAVDPKGTVFIVGGTAVVPFDPEILFALMAYLNSSTINNLVQQTTPEFRGGFQKFEPQHIQRIPVINRLVEDPIFLGQLTEMAMLISSINEDESARKDVEIKINLLIANAVEEQGIRIPA